MKKPVKIINPQNDLKKSYVIRYELGLIIALSALIFISKIHIQASNEVDMKVAETIEEVFVEEIIQTKQDIKIPPPPRPLIPVAVPNDHIIEDEVIELDAELKFDDIIELPPAPPKHIDNIEEEVFVVVEQMPELIGGMASIQKHVRYPDIAVMAGIEGRVVVQFVIDQEGNVNDPIVVRGIGGGCDEEALKAVKKAKFIPGRQRGKPVFVRYTLPIAFKLTNS